MKVLLTTTLAVLTITFPAYATERPRYITNFRAGTVLTPEDAKIRRAWKHRPLSSYILAAGLNVRVLDPSPEFYIYVGPELRHEKSVQIYQDDRFTSTITQLSAVSGLAWEPEFWQSRFGVRLQTSFSLWGRVSSKLSAPTKAHATIADPDPWSGISTGAYYKVTDVWWVSLQGDFKPPWNAITLGTDFAF